MVYFNPIVYFIKSFIRLFTRRFFWVLLFLVCIFLAFIIFNNNGVFAVTNYSGIDSSSFNSSDLTTAKSLVGSSIWDNENYDIFLSNDGTKCVYYYDTTKFIYSDDYDITDFCYSVTYNNGAYGVVKFSSASSSHAPYLSTTDSQVIKYFSGDNYTSQWPYFLTGVSDNKLKLYIVRTHFPIYNQGGSLIAEATNPIVRPPYFITTNEELQTFDFDYLQINGGTTKYTSYFEPLDQTYTAEFKLTYYYKGVATNIDILPEYVAVNTQKNTRQINIPYNVLTNKVIVRNGEKFSFRFSYENGYESGYELTTGELTYDLTTEQEEEINADSDKQVQGQILETQQQTNDKLDNLDSTINDSNIDNITDDTLPSDDTNDITRDGVNGIFTSIYNAFCTGNAQDIVFPIPFTDKNITLQSNYVNNMLSSNGASWVVIIIQAFWWYLISRFIIKDVMDKINKIKSGNIEDIETTNIRGDML